MSKTTIRCGFIGLGSQGAPIARRIVEGGFPLALWARRPATLEPYRDTAATYPASLAELGAACDHVGVCVVDDAGVRAVCDELMAAMAPGGRIVIHSTVSPQLCRTLEAEAAARGLALIDAPVSGGPHAAKAGTLTIMIGGSAETAAAARPVFETFGGLIVHLGEIGAGQYAKLLNNTLMAANIALVHEATTAAETLKLNIAEFHEVLKASSGGSAALVAYCRLPRLAAFDHGAALLQKDVGLLNDLLGPDDAACAELTRAASPFLALVRATAAAPNSPA
jgi:3-hydroxyisobutyrate dehydrogenase-like beta-hydroxyacid dehydrogenase